MRTWRYGVSGQREVPRLKALSEPRDRYHLGETGEPVRMAPLQA